MDTEQRKLLDAYIAAHYIEGGELGNRLFYLRRDKRRG